MVWWHKLRRRLMRQKPILLVMCLDDMVLVHPDMDSTRVCSRCGRPVGIYPSGQQVLQRDKRVQIICNRCQPLPLGFRLAPGARREIFQSTWKR